MAQKAAILCYAINARSMGQRALAVEPEPVGTILNRRFATLTLSKRRAAHAARRCIEARFVIAMIFRGARGLWEADAA